MTSKPHRLSACHRHPATPVTGFCAYCLRDRLTGIQSPSSSSAVDHYYSPSPPPSLRRAKSFSASAASDAVSEPRRRSCEVRLRSTLSNLFTVDDQSKKTKEKNQLNRNPQFEEEHNVEDVRVCIGIGRNDEEAEVEKKTMKEFIDIELRNRKNAAARDSRSFWEAASAFSEKLMKWRWKNKSKKRRSFAGNGNGNRVVEKKERAWRLRETQSEVGEYGLGRRSCDTDPRLSVDVSRISVDDSYSRISCDPYSIDLGRVSIDNDLRLSIDTYSRLYVDKDQISVDNDSRVTLDKPRASCDGYLMGRQCHRLSPMVVVEEDSNVGPDSRRRLDRLSSRRRQSMAEADELRVTSNAKVSPATTELFYSAESLISEKDLDLRTENVKSISDVQDDRVMKGSASNDAPDSDVVAHKGFKKFHKWRGAWNKLHSAVHRNQKGECDAGNAVNNKPIAESWQTLRRVVNVQQSSENFSSCRNPCRMAGLISRLGSTETKKGNVLNRRQEFTPQRNRSVRHSPSNLDNGLLRFYLTPLRSYRRSKSGKSSLKDLRPIARSLF